MYYINLQKESKQTEFMKNRICIWLVNQLLKRKRMTLNEIQEEWRAHNADYDINLHRNTFMSYKRVTEDMFDINISCDRRTNEYYIEFPEGMSSSPVNQWLIRTASTSDVISRHKRLSDRIVLENTFGGEEHLDAITDAMYRNKCVNIVYHSYWMEPQNFTVEPYFIKFFRQRWYLIGHCHERNALRVYSLDRMDSAIKSEKSFVMKDQNYPQIIYNDNFGIIHGDEKTISHDIILKFTIQQGRYIQTRPLHHTQEIISQDENHMIFNMHMKITLDLVQELLSYGSSLQVLGPECLINEIRKNIKEMNDLYK